MTEYIRQIKLQFRDIYKFIPNGGTENDPTFNNIPNGEYLMVIDGKSDVIKIIDGKINCCNL